MNVSYYKMPIIVDDGMSGKPRWTRIGIFIIGNSFLILQNAFSI